MGIYTHVDAFPLCSAPSEAKQKQTFLFLLDLNVVRVLTE